MNSKEEGKVWSGGDKDRDLSQLTYLNRLQREYVAMEIRSKIYPNYSDKAYFRTIMLYKKEKIVDIARRNHLPTLFSDLKIEEEIYGCVMKERGLPDFQYRDQATREKHDLKDRTNYFYPTSDVKVFVEIDSYIMGVIDSYDVDNQIVHVKCKGDQHVRLVKENQVRRIL